MGQVTEDDWTKFLNDRLTSDLKAVICENYLLYQHRAMAQTNKHGRKLKTSKKVGQVELLAEMRDVPCILQDASKYKIGAMWGGFEIPSNHSISHQFVAVAHGVFYLQSVGIRKPVINNGASSPSVE